jgi:hypothetical protein
MLGLAYVVQTMGSDCGYEKQSLLIYRAKLTQMTYNPISLAAFIYSLTNTCKR